MECALLIGTVLGPEKTQPGLRAQIPRTTRTCRVEKGRKGPPGGESGTCQGPRPERGGRRACGAASAAGPAASRGPLDGSASSRSQQELMERGGGKTGRSRRGGSAFAEITLLELPPRAKLLGAGGRRGARGAARLSRLQHVTDVERGQRDVSHSSCVTSVTSGVRFTCTAHLSVHRPHVEGSEATGGGVWLPNWTAWV